MIACVCTAASNHTGPGNTETARRADRLDGAGPLVGRLSKESDRPCGWDLAQVPLWAAGEFYRLLRESLATDELPLHISATPLESDSAAGLDGPAEADQLGTPDDPAYRFDVTYQWWHRPDDGPYLDDLTILVRRSRAGRGEIHAL